MTAVSERGKYTSNRLPSRGRLRTSIAPPISVTMPCTSAKPSPVPVPELLVVKNGSKIRPHRLRLHAGAAVFDAEFHVSAGRQRPVRQAALRRRFVQVERNRERAACRHRVDRVGAQIHDELVHVRGSVMTATPLASPVCTCMRILSGIDARTRSQVSLVTAATFTYIRFPLRGAAVGQDLVHQRTSAMCGLHDIADVSPARRRAGGAASAISR